MADLSERLKPAPDGITIEKLEVEFDIPVTLSSAQHRKLHDLVTEIANSPWNQPKEGVLWFGYEGGRMNLSNIDAALLGKAPGANPPADGEEPTTDDTVLVLGVHARAFHDQQEREEVELERQGLGYCDTCGEPQVRSAVGAVCRNGHYGAISVARPPRHRG